MKKSKIIINRRASYDYHLGDKIIAGISLHGRAVKNIRLNHVSFKDSFVQIKDNTVWIKNLQILRLDEKDKKEKYQLLLTKNQIKNLKKDISTKNNTIVPTKLILGKYIKLEIAPAVGKKQYDKRQTIKKRENQIEIKRRLKRG